MTGTSWRMCVLYSSQEIVGFGSCVLGNANGERHCEIRRKPSMESSANCNTEGASMLLEALHFELQQFYLKIRKVHCSKTLSRMKVSQNKKPMSQVCQYFVRTRCARTVAATPHCFSTTPDCRPCLMTSSGIEKKLG